MPARWNSFVSSSRWKWREGSSSISLWSATEILSSSPFDLGSMAYAIEASGTTSFGSTTGWSFVVSVSPVVVSLSFATATMSPARASDTLTCSLPCGRNSPENRSADPTRGIPVAAVGLKVAREDAQVGDAAGEGVRDRLEDLRHGRVLLVAEDAHGLAVLAGALGDAAFGAREQRDAGIHDADHADAERRRGAEHRKNLPRRDLFFQARHAGRAGSSVPCAKNFSIKRVLALRDHLDEALVLFLGPRRERFWDRSVDALSVLVQVGLHAHEIDGAAEAALLADRDLERDDAAPELLVERVHRALE